MLRAVQTVGKTPTETVCFKATFKDNERPKEKHVKALIDIANQEANVQWSVAVRQKSLVDVLAERLQEKPWEVALKTLIVVHRLMREANANFSEHLYQRSDILNLSGFLDQTSTMSWGQSKFVNQYSAFLFEKIFCYHQIGFFVEKRIAVEGAKFIQKLSFTRLQKLVPLVERLFSRLLECELYTSEGAHPISNNAYFQLIKDALRIQSVASVCVLNMLEVFKSSGLERARWTLATYRSFLEKNKKFVRWIDRAVKGNIVQRDLVPTNSFPQTLADSLQAYIRQLEKHPEKRPAAKWDKEPEVGNLRDLLKDEDVDIDLDDADDSEDDAAAAASSSSKSKRSRRRSARARTRSRTDSADADESSRSGRGRSSKKNTLDANASTPRLDKPQKRSRSSKAGQRRRSRAGSGSGPSQQQPHPRGPFGGGSGDDRRRHQSSQDEQPVSLLDDSPPPSSSRRPNAASAGADGDPLDSLAMYFSSATTISASGPVYASSSAAAASSHSHHNGGSGGNSQNGVSPFDEMDDLFDFNGSSSQPQAFVEAKAIPNPFDDFEDSSQQQQQESQKSMSGQVAKRLVNNKNTRKNPQATPFDDLVLF